MQAIEKLINDLRKEVEERGAGKILLQIPEGLKTKASSIVKGLEKTGVSIVLSADPCFGACDLRDHEAKTLGCDLLIHIGHADFGVEPEIPVIYYEFHMEYDFTKILRKDIKKLQNFKRISIMTTVQYVDSIPKIKEFLENEGKEVIVGNNTKTGYPGHVLGCDYSAIDQEGDCFIYFGSGRFHPSGFLTEKPFFVVDSEKKELVDISPEVKKNIIKKELSLEKARGLKHFIVYVSTKTGQMNIEKASEVKKKLEAKNKEALIVSADMLTPSKLLGIKYDVIINTACPRLRDDSSQFKKIILNSMDVDKL